jgi:serine/threonine protein kinase/TolA-binding protein
MPFPGMSDELGSAKTSVSGKNPAHVPGDEQHPERVGNFTLGRLLGRGGMASVYLANQEGTHRQVAIKLMDPGLKKAPDFVQRFLNEAQATASLRHPNVVETVAHGEADGWYFIAAEYVDGGNVAQLLHQMGELPPALAAELVTQLLAGLTHAHDKGIVHRDLKPENLMLSAGGILKVGDFGIARSADTTQPLTQTGTLIGTVGYMSPEQARGEVVDQRSDLFTVGIILYELLTGKNPFAAESPAASITRILNCAAPPIYSVRPHAATELDGFIDRLLHPDKEQRFGSSKEAHEALVGFVGKRRSAWPTMVAECLRRPEEMRKKLGEEASAGLVAEAKPLLKGNSIEQNHAAVKLKYALDFQPDNAEAMALLSSLKGVQFGPTKNAKILELEKYLEKYPDTAQALQQLSQLYKMEGNLVRAAVYQKLYLRQRPSDAYAWSQLFQLTGERQPKLRTTPDARAVGPAPYPHNALTQPFVEGRTGLIAPPAMSPPRQPMPVVSTAPAPENVKAKNPWVARGIVFGLLAALAAGLFVANREMNRAVERAEKAQAEAAEALSRQQAEMQRRMKEETEKAQAIAIEVETERESQALLADGVRELGEERYTHAVEALDKLIEKYPRRESALRARFVRGKALLALDKKTDAVRDLTVFLEQRADSPDGPEALLRRAQAYSKNLQLDEAQADFKTFLEKHPQHALAMEARLARAELLVMREKYDEARADLDAVVTGKAKPEEVEAAKAQLAKLPKKEERKKE